MVLVRRAVEKDLDEVLKIYSEAREKFKEEGTFQWKNGYPNEDTFYEDLKDNYVVVAEIDGEVCGVMTLVTSKDVNYEVSSAVNWLNNEDYICIHRIAVSKKFYKKGIGSRLVEYAIEFCRNVKRNNIKVDTHLNNYDMKKLITKYGFVYCGKIMLLEKDNELRDAYQKDNI